MNSIPNDLLRNVKKFAFLQTLGYEPRVHGNGFIQLDIDESRRLNFWGHPAIPCQKVPIPIHDHTFDFVSTIIKGRLINVVYDLVYTGNIKPFKVYVAKTREREDTKLEPLNVNYCRPEVRRAEIVMEGQKYWMKAFDMHEIFTPEPSITLMDKSIPTINDSIGRTPRVLIPVGKEPDNEFNRYDTPLDVLWDIIKDIMENC